MNEVRRLVLALLAFVSVVPAGPARAVVFTEYPLPAASYPNFLVLDYDGSVVFAEFGRDKIGRIKNGVLDELNTSVGCGPVGVTVGADGSVYYTCAGKKALGTVVFADQFISETTIPEQPTGPIASGPDGNLWFTSGPDLIIVTTGFTPVAGGNVEHDFFGVSSSGDGGVWAAEPQGDYLWHWQISAGSLAGYAHAVPTTGAHPRQVTWCQGYGDVFGTQNDSSKLLLARFEASSQSVLVTEHSTPLSGPAAGIACGLDGSVWFTVPSTNKVGRLTAAGTVEEFTVPTALSNPYGIFVGPDNSVWFSENTAHKIGRLRLRPQGDANGDGQIDVSDVFYLINFLFAGGPEPVP